MGHAIMEAAVAIWNSGAGLSVGKTQRRTKTKIN
jgi:hypothetical protein